MFAKTFLKITQISQVKRCFQGLNVICIHVYGDALNGLPRMPVSKNVNSERTSAKICSWFVQKKLGNSPSITVLNTVEPLHNGHLDDRRKAPLWRGGRYEEVDV